MDALHNCFPSLDGRGKGRVTPLPNPLPQGERE